MAIDNQNLLEEVFKARKEVKTDSYNMSVGEILNLFSDGEINLNPAFQRNFRWDNENKTRFIESLIIGIPVPSIFVAQNTDVKWTVVDGFQRISTMLQFTGYLKDREPFALETCKYIPSIEGKTWEDLPVEVKRLVKHAKFPVNIILTEDSLTSQYELFQRLNTGGLQLSDQEIRN